MFRGFFVTSCLLVLSCVQVCLGAPPQVAPPNSVDAEHAKRMADGLKVFQQHVRATLVGQCVQCHGGEETEGEFDLVTREGLLRGGAEGKAVIPGDTKASRLMRLIRHETEPEMPLDAAKLPKEQIAHISRWIELGAPYDRPLMERSEEITSWKDRRVPPEAKDYWAFRPLPQVEPPPVASAESARTPVDAFVLARLADKRLSPSPRASWRQLIRRAYLDLHGIPPSPEEVDQFLANPSPQEWERLIDRLLAHSRYGERWARHWLDVARFAESHGFEHDYDRKYAYHYRDFVIQALNQDMPFDQFVRWQLAGDEFAPESPLAMMATGFIGAGVFPTQITAKEVEPARYDAIDDMAATTGSAILGLSIGCARCHDHKFDPIPQADYYRFVSTFTTTVRSEIDLDLRDADQRKEDQRQIASQLQEVRDQLRKFEEAQLPVLFAKYVEALKREAGGESAPARWHVLDIQRVETMGGTRLKTLEDGSLLAEGESPNQETYVLVAKPNATAITAVRIEALIHKSLPRGGPGRAANGNFVLGTFLLESLSADDAPEAVPQKLSKAVASHQQNKGDLSIAASISDADPSTGWAVDFGGIGKDQAAVFELAAPVSTDDATLLRFTLKFGHPNARHVLGRLRLSVSTAAPPFDVSADREPGKLPRPKGKVWALGIEPLLRGGREKTSPQAEYYEQALKWFATTVPQWQELKARVDKIEKDEAKQHMTKVQVTSEGVKPMRHHTQGKDFFESTYFLKRGDVHQKDGEATLSFPQVLTRNGKSASYWQEPPPAGWRTSYRRRALANWITDAQDGAGHLAARVIVNRIWQHHFGRGIVATPSDFGRQGEPPTHPQLLDWLAADLVQHGWRLKRLHKLVMTSAVYMQDHEPDASAAAVDPENIFLWRWQPRRLEAEAIRDSILAVAGLLDDRMYGAGTLDQNMRRRSIYFTVKRSRLIPMMQLFDVPEPLVSIGRRPTTTIAPQALLFLNGKQVRSYAEGLAKRAAPADSTTDREAVMRAFSIALGRPPAEAEIAEAALFVNGQRETYEAQGHKNARFLALTDYCQVMLGLNEFLYIE